MISLITRINYSPWLGLKEKNEFDFAEHYSSQHNLFVMQVMRYTDKQLKRQAIRSTRMVNLIRCYSVLKSGTGFL